MILKALIFDFDGLILDTETPDFIVLSEQYRRYGTDLRPERWMHGLAQPMATIPTANSRH